MLLLVGLVLAACGTRRDMAELQAAARVEVTGASADTPVEDPTASSDVVGTPDAGADRTVHQAAQPDSGGADDASTCAPNCSPLVIGTVGTYSGVVGQNVRPGVRALQAWAASVNASGGLNGHPVEVVVADDGGDPARHRALLQELVEDRGVVAFVYNAAPLSGQASVDYIARAHVPVIGSEATGDWFFANPYFFPQSSSGRNLGAAVMGAARTVAPQSETAMGVLYCSEGIPICEQARSDGPTNARATNWDFVYSGSASLAQPDYTATCLSARDQGAQVILVAMDANSLVRVARSCDNVGYHPKLLISQQVLLPFLAEEPRLQGSYGAALNAPWFDASNPAVAEFQRAMRQYAPGEDFAGSPMQGWASAKLLEAAGPSISEPPTSESILDGLYALENETLGGLAPPLTFTRGRPPSRSACAWPLVIRDNDYQHAGDGSMVCIDPPRVG